MDADKKTFDEFMDGSKFFTIPVYQRKYDWQQAHCQKLFDDIKKIIKNDKTHFLGTFVYQQKKNNYVIVDGQQRITSLVLLAKSLCDLIDDEELKEEILGRYIKHSIGKGMKDKCKLIPTEYDRDVFEKIMAHDDFNENFFSDPEKSSVMYRNFIFFREKISEREYSPQEIYEAIQKIDIVRINIETGENPQEIFESLNSTGLYLTQSDLFRNYLLMSLDYEDQEILYKKYWLEIEKLLRSSEEIEKFMVQYLMVRRKSDSVTMGNKKIKLSDKNLYEVFKRYFVENYTDSDKSKNVEACLKDIYRYAIFYKKFSFNDENVFDNLSALEKKFFELTYLIKASGAPIVLMYLYDKYEKKFFNEETFIKFVEIMISMAFRAKVCGYKGINSQFASNFIARLDKSDSFNEDTFWQMITVGKGKYSFPDDNFFKENLMTTDLYSRIKGAGCKYLLYSLEKNSEHPHELPSYSVGTIEHIMPQTLNKDWKNYLEEKNDLVAHEIFLHTLGNLTLTAYNSSLSNSIFEKKKKEYAKSNFFYTRSLKDITDWTSKQIQERAEKLAGEALKIWNLPEKYSFASVDAKNIFTLEDDFENFMGKKPALLSISDKEHEIKTWRALLEEVIKNLYSLDKEIFELAAQKENIPSKLFSTGFGKIDPTFFMSTERCLRITKILVENFDSICGTNFKDEIWFTLKK